MVGRGKRATFRRGRIIIGPGRRAGYKAGRVGYSVSWVPLCVLNGSMLMIGKNEE